MSGIPFFRRKASLNLYKNPKMILSKMTFTSDFTDSERGNLYPLKAKSGDVTETVDGAGYSVSGDGYAVRLLGGFFPYANYEADILCGKGGFVFSCGNNFFSAIFSRKDNFIEINENGDTERIITDNKSGTRFTVSFCGNDVFVYVAENGKSECVFRKKIDVLGDLLDEKTFFETKSQVILYGNSRVENVISYLDTGVCQADIRPVRYEDGTVICENGLIYFTVSARLNSGNYQCVLSMKKDTCEFNISGAIFYDTGDGRWCGDIASSVIFNRKTEKWQYWACGFSKGHICGCGECETDPRFGINLLELNLMEQGENQSGELFLGVEGDEDPDFYFDKDKNKWYLTLCRLTNGVYRYFMFESEEPLKNYRFVQKTQSGCETGGSFVKTQLGYYFICGSDFDKKSVYHVYKTSDFSEFSTVECEDPDGGFRGWGTVFALPCGKKEKFTWMTFDRYLGDREWNWSYGNLYIFESETLKKTVD